MSQMANMMSMLQQQQENMGQARKRTNGVSASGVSWIVSTFPKSVKNNNTFAVTPLVLTPSVCNQQAFMRRQTELEGSIKWQFEQMMEAQQTK